MQACKHAHTTEPTPVNQGRGIGFSWGRVAAGGRGVSQGVINFVLFYVLQKNRIPILITILFKSWVIRPPPPFPTPHAYPTMFFYNRRLRVYCPSRLGRVGREHIDHAGIVGRRAAEGGALPAHAVVVEKLKG